MGIINTWTALRPYAAGREVEVIGNRTWYSLVDAQAVATGPKDVIVPWTWEARAGDARYIVVNRPTSLGIVVIGGYDTYSAARAARIAQTYGRSVCLMVNDEVDSVPNPIHIYFVIDCNHLPPGPPGPEKLVGFTFDYAEATLMASDHPGAAIFAWHIQDVYATTIGPPPVMVISPETAARTMIETYIRNRWNRISLSSTLACQIPNHHGYDEICPLFFRESPYDPSDPSDPHLAPFAITDLRDVGTPGDEDYVPGTGWVEMWTSDVSRFSPEQGGTGCEHYGMELKVWITTPASRGEEQAECIADAIKALLSELYMTPAGQAALSRLVYVRYQAHLQPPFRMVSEESNGMLITTCRFLLTRVETFIGSVPPAIVAT